MKPSKAPSAKPLTLEQRCQTLITGWEAMMADLASEAAKDRAAGLTWTAEAQEVGRLALKGCVAGLKAALEEDGK